MNTKIKFLALLLLTSMFFIFSSCEKDLYEEAIIQQKNELYIKKVSLFELLKTDNQKLIDAVDNLNLKNENILSKKRYNKKSDFYIDDTNGTEIISIDGHKSYTFQIFNNDVNKKIENVLFTENKNGEYDVFRVKYNFNEEDYKKLNKKDIIKHKVVYEPIMNTNARTTEFCLTIYTIYSGGCTRTHENGVTCNDETVTSEQYCADDYTTIIENNSSFITISGTGWGTGTFTNTNTTVSPSGVFTTLVITPGMTFINSLNFNTPDGLFSLSSEAQQIIFNYLTTHNFDAPTKARVKYVLDNFNFFWVNEQPVGTDIDIFNYLAQDNFSANSEAFVNQCITRMSQNPNTFTSIIPLLIEEKIDFTNLDPCSKEVFTTVKNSTVCDIAQVLAKLNTNGTVYNTTIKSEVAPNQKPAQTVHNSACNYTIYISTDYAGKTKLFIAASMFHEMVHCYFMSLFDDYYNNNPPNLNAYNDFAYLFHFYVTLKKPASIDPADVHHQQMAADYVDAIARALQEYQTGTPVETGASPEQIYIDLAWGGLIGTPVFEATYPIGNPNRQRIIDRYICEQNGSVIGAGTPNAQTPIGNPCVK